MKLKVLKTYFGYDSLKPKQEVIIDQILAGRDTLSILHTGFGKSLIFQIPGLIFPGLTLVICPLISLMKDQVDELQRRGINARYIASTLDQNEISSIYRDLDNLKFLYVSGERLGNAEFIKNVKNISFIAVDEAHTLLWSKGFRKNLKAITNFINNLEKRPIIAAFTATLLEQDLRFIFDFLTLIDPYITVTAPKRSNLVYKVYKGNKFKNLEKILKQHANDKGIIYCLSIAELENVHGYLKDRYQVRKYHGKMTKEEKEENQNNFTNLMVATNAFGMGIDIPDIRFVVIYELPINILDLIQQIGRAGRDGVTSFGYIMYDPFNLKRELNFLRQGNLKQNEKEFQNVLRFIYAKDKERYIENLFKF